MERFDDELNKLTKYHEEEWRDPTCVVVEGGLGMGKSRVLNAFKVRTPAKTGTNGRVYPFSIWLEIMGLLGDWICHGPWDCPRVHV